MRDVWLRLDVDHASSSRPLHALRALTGLPIPRFLDHVHETLRLLRGQEVPRVWFFRDFTCPDTFDEPHGAHLTSPETAEREIEAVRSKLGDFDLFSCHGFSRVRSGRWWTAGDSWDIEEEYGLRCVNGLVHDTVSRWHGALGELDHILFHPCYVRSHGEVLLRILDEVNKSGNGAM